MTLQHSPRVATDDKLRPAVAAIVHARRGSADALLAEFARDLRGRGWRVRGVVQEDTVDRMRRARRMVLVDLDQGIRFPISQDLGPGSAACSVDPQGVAAASIALRRIAAEGADLVVANRFGELEAGGGGLAAEMLALMSGGIPLLTVVNERFLEEWRRFTGNAAAELPTRREALEAWFAGIPRKKT